MNWLKARFREPSTWNACGIVVLSLLPFVGVPSVVVAALSSGLAAIAGAKPEVGAKPAQ